MQEWEIDVVCDKSDVMSHLYINTNDWCNAHLPAIVNGPNGPTMEGAQLADRLMYQVRQAVPAALVIVGSLGGDLDERVSVHVEGRASLIPYENRIAIAVCVDNEANPAL